MMYHAHVNIKFLLSDHLGNKPPTNLCTSTAWVSVQPTIINHDVMNNSSINAEYRSIVVSLETTFRCQQQLCEMNTQSSLRADIYKLISRTDSPGQTGESLWTHKDENILSSQVSVHSELTQHIAVCSRSATHLEAQVGWLWTVWAWHAYYVYLSCCDKLRTTSRIG